MVDQKALKSRGIGRLGWISIGRQASREREVSRGFFTAETVLATARLSTTLNYKYVSVVYPV